MRPDPLSQMSQPWNQQPGWAASTGLLEIRSPERGALLSGGHGNGGCPLTVPIVTRPQSQGISYRNLPQRSPWKPGSAHGWSGRCEHPGGGGTGGDTLGGVCVTVCVREWMTLRMCIISILVVCV